VISIYLYYKLPLYALLLVTLGNTLAALTGYYLIRRLGRWRSQFDIQSDAISISMVALSATTIDATIGSVAFCWGGFLPFASFSRLWMNWWAGSSVGTILLLPFLLSMGPFPWRFPKLILQDFVRAACILIVTCLCLHFVFFSGHQGSFYSMLLFPTVLLGAYFLKPMGLRVQMFLIAVVSIYATLHNQGPFSEGSASEPRIYLQLFLAGIALTSLFLEGFHRAGHYWMPALSLVVGWTCTAAIFFSFSATRKNREQSRFNTIVGDVTDRMATKMRIYEDALRAGVSLYLGSRTVEALEWHNFTRSLRISEHYGTIDGMGLILPLEPKSLREFQKEIAKRGVKNFKVRPFDNSLSSRTESSQTSVRAPIVFAQTDRGQKNPVGLDVFSDPIRKETLMLSLQHRSVTATPRIERMQEIDDGPGFVLYVPINFNGDEPLLEKKLSPVGWVYAPVLAQRFFSGLRGRFWEEIDIFVFDRADLSESSLLFRTDNDEADLPSFQTTTQVELAQHKFYVGWRKGPGFISPFNPSEAWVGFSGAMISLLFAAMLVSLRETNQRATTIANEKTALLTERERSLQQIRERFALAVRGSNDGLWDWNLVTNEVYYSPRWKEMLGYGDQEIPDVYSSWLGLIHPGDLDRALKAIQDYLERKTSLFHLEHRLRHKDGSYRWILARGVALWDASDKPYRMAGSHTDITAIKETQVRLIESKESALAGARAKSDFLANMSHEIRTPLSGIIGVSSLLDDTSLDADQKEFVETIRQSAESLLSVINDILDFSKIEAGKLTLESVPFDLQSELQRIFHLMRFAADQKKLRLQIQLDPALKSHYKGDPTRIRQVLVNLISNAIKFSFKGEVLVRVLQLSPGRVRFSVSDEGIGIPDGMHEQIFLPFSQGDSSTSREFGGTGLGLSICKNLVELMGGKIYVESAIGAGSEFRFEIPLEPFEISEQELSLDSEVAKAIDFRPLSARVLIAEDNQVSMRIATAVLRKFGVTVIPASNGHEVMELLKNQVVDLILMDCQMPELDGYQTTQEIRASRDPKVRDLPVIAMTANSLKGDREACLSSGMSDYLAKPVRPETLYAMLAKWLERSHAPSALVAVSRVEPTEPLDMQILKALASLSPAGGTDVLKRVIDVYLDYYPRHFSAIRQSLKQSNWNEIRREAHSLKGASGGIGLQVVAYLCQQIEDRAQTAPNELEPLIERLENELERGVQSLRAVPTEASAWT
jgi:PAS domain S-box-containing protein